MIEKSQIIKRREDGSVSVATVNIEPSLTQQQFKDECDINKIIKSYEATGEFTHKTSKVGQYADFSGIRDYHEMVEKVAYAQEAFMTLPAQVRLKFQNDPGELLQFIQNPANREEAMRIGLIEKPETTTLNIPNPQPPNPNPQPQP